MIGEYEINNRFGLHPGGPKSIPRHNQCRVEFIAMANFLDNLLPDGRAKSLAFTALQEASMWSNFAIAELVPFVLPEDDAPNNQLVLNLGGEVVVNQPPHIIQNYPKGDTGP